MAIFNNTVGVFRSRARIATTTPTSSKIDRRWITGEFKGFNCGGYQNSARLTSADEFIRIAGYGANLLRVGCSLTETGTNTYSYFLHADDEAYLDWFITQATSNKLSVLLVVGLIGSEGATSDHWGHDVAKNTVGNVLSYMASKYKGNATVVGFDLLNEPVMTGAYTDATWTDFATHLVNCIRFADKDRTIVIETTNYANRNKLTALIPLPYQNIVYSIHFYIPLDFTHQGVNGYPTPPTHGNVYPGFNDGTNPLWTQSTISSTGMQAIRNFKASYNVPILVGEFGCDIYADLDSRYNWLNDVMAIFDTEEWSWLYHSQGDWEGWDFRKQDVNNSGTITNVANNRLENLLKSYM